jgi:glycosyltransferase involved in cell wall biosynthesis
MSQLRVLVAHNRYQWPGGEDTVVDAEVDLLRRHGHEVETYLRHNEELAGMSAIEALAETVWSRRTSREIEKLVAKFQPDVIHAHNTFAVVSASLYWAAARSKVPIVQTLHNFRLLCVQGMFLRGGEVCEACLGHIPWRGVVRKCYRDSAAHSAAIAAMLGVHRALGTYQYKVARYIALNEFCKQKFVAGGLPSARITVKPNFADVPRPPAGPRRNGLYVGRFSPEKGIDVLARALEAAPHAIIDAIGAGPDADKLADRAQVRMLGWQDAATIYQRMQQASYLVMPSIWYENFPRTLVEAFGCGLPVIASRLGALSELVEHNVTGLLFDPGSPDDLARQIAWADQFPDKMRAMGERARAKYEEAFTPEKNYDCLMAIYDDAIADTFVEAHA